MCFSPGTLSISQETEKVNASEAGATMPNLINGCRLIPDMAYISITQTSGWIT